MSSGANTLVLVIITMVHTINQTIIAPILLKYHYLYQRIIIVLNLNVIKKRAIINKVNRSKKRAINYQ